MNPPRYATPAAFRRALEDRLRERAEATGEDLERLRRILAFDRVLARLFTEGASAPWVVKGGFALEVRYPLAARTTKDLDLNIVGTGDSSTHVDPLVALRERLQEATASDPGDGFVVRIGLPGQDRHGPNPRSARFPIEVHLAGRVFARFHIDVGLGDVGAGAADWMVGEDLLAFADILPARFAVVFVEQQIAEKLHALTRPRGRAANTRVKDLVDLVLLLEREQPAPDVVRSAMESTFELYATHPIPVELPSPPAGWVAPYEALAAEAKVSARTSDEAHHLVAGFWQALRGRQHP